VTRLGNMYGPDATFAGVPPVDFADTAALSRAGAVILGAPFDGGTSYRPGARFGPQAIRFTDYLPHDGSRPHLALGVDPLSDLPVLDAGDVKMLPGEIESSLRKLEDAVLAVTEAGPLVVVLGGDHSITFANATAVARKVGWGRLALVHFDAHADTGETQFGSLWGHGTPMRRLIESGAVRGERFFQVGLRGYWPGP
jgi:arginase family enzyme